MKRPVYRWAIVVFAFGVFLAALFWSVLASGLYLGDAADHLIEALPMYLGAHPLWEPNILLGYPLFADPNWLYWYPPALLRVIPHSFNAFVLSAYLLAACGTYGLVRSLTRSTTAAIVGGLIYALGGFMIGHIGHVTIVHPAGWVPFVLWALVELRRGGGRRWLCLGSISLACSVLGGQPQVFTYTLILAVAFALSFARTAPVGAKRYAVRASSMLALGTTLSAVAIIPALELMRVSTRAGMPFEMFVGFADPVLEVPIRLFFPYFLGGTTIAPYQYSAFGTAQFAEMSNYVGLPATVLALLAIRSCWPLGEVRFWTAVAAVAIVLSTGNDLGIGWLMYHVPVYDLFRAPGRHAMEFSLAVAVLAGYGVVALESGRTTRLRLVKCGVLTIALMAATLALIAGLYAFFPAADVANVVGPTRPSLDPLRNAALGIPLAVMIVTFVALIVWSGRPQAAGAQAMLVAAVALDLGSFGWFAYWHWGAFPATSLQPPAYVEGLRSGLAPWRQRVLALASDDTRSAIAPDLNLLWDFPEAGGYTPLVMKRTAAFLEPPFGAALDLAAVRYLVVPAGLRARAEIERDRARWRYVGMAQGDAAYENERALPRAWIVRRAVPATEDDALARARAGDFDPRLDALVEGLAQAGASTATRSGRVDVIGSATAEMQLKTDCATRCFVVTSDATYPGWSANVDGVGTRIYAADYALRGLFVPAGRHVVTLTYWPASLMLGAAVSGLAFLCLCATVAVPAARRPAKRRASGEMLARKS